MKYLTHVITVWVVVWILIWAGVALACEGLAGKYALYTSGGSYRTLGNAACLVRVALSGKILGKGGCIGDQYYGIRGGRLNMDPECFITGHINVGKERIYIRFSTMSLSGETITGVLGASQLGEIEGSFTMVRWRKSFN